MSAGKGTAREHDLAARWQVIAWARECAAQFEARVRASTKVSDPIVPVSMGVCAAFVQEMRFLVFSRWDVD